MKTGLERAKHQRAARFGRSDTKTGLERTKHQRAARFGRSDTPAGARARSAELRPTAE
jgi:hypothetical protein